MLKIKKIKIYLVNEILSNTWIFLAILVILGLIIRLYNLGGIQEEIFDEVYFVKFAKNYLSGQSFFDIHPPLGKIIIAGGIKLLGDTYFAWRVMAAIFGSATILIGYFIGRELKNKIVGLFVALIIFLDGMILVYSRVGLMDIFLVFFIMLGFYFFLRFANKSKISYLILAGVCLGLAASIKYIGGLLIFAYIATAIIKKIPFKKYLFYYLFSLILIPTIIYLFLFVFNFQLNKEFISKVIEWHKQSLNYNLTLKEGHPYGSKWWMWFILLRPIWLYFKDINNQFVGIIGLGNPLAWWSSLVVVPLLLFEYIKRKDKNSLLIFCAFAIFLLPWAFFSRVLFYYHAMPSFIFLTFGIAYLLEKLIHDKFGKVIVAVYFIILIFLFIYFLPIWIGIPISHDAFYNRMWLRGWI